MLWPKVVYKFPWTHDLNIGWLIDMDTEALDQIIKRCGSDYVSRRLTIQVEHAASVLGPGLGSFHFENLDLALKLFGKMLKVLGIWDRGFANITAHKIVHNNVIIPGLPAAFEGFKILHLSDLHLDVRPGFGAHLGRIISSQKFDLCLITGDYRFHTHSDYYPTFHEIEKLSRDLKAPFGNYGILGNHDFLEFVPKLERHHIKMLLNENAVIEKEGEELWIIGLDDAHFYGVHNYEKAFSGIPGSATKVLMIHSPETLEDAYKYKADFILSGHTHAGQLCLPGGIPIWMNANCPRSYCKGAWTYKGIPGFTSAGAGSSGLPLRLNCPPEIIIHHLKSKPLS